MFIGYEELINTMKERLYCMIETMFRSKLSVGVIVFVLTLSSMYIFTLTKSNQYVIIKSSCQPTEKVSYRLLDSVDFTEDVMNSTKKEVTHIMFLKVHKCASSTMTNLFYRFGMKRNLSFVLPLNTNYVSNQMHYFSDILAPLPPEVCVNQNGGMCQRVSVNKYDILCNHMVFNRLKCRKLLHSDSMYIGIVREPFKQFISSAFYYKFKYHYEYLERLANDTFIVDLIREPQKYESTVMMESMTFNSMTYDFGFNLKTVRAAEKVNNTTFEKFLNKTQNIFSLVMVVEKFDESLIIMKRMLNWSLRDVLYLKNNEFKLKSNESVAMATKTISTQDMKLFRKRNRFDYRLYDFFLERLNLQISREQRLQEEVRYFKLVLKDLESFCYSNLMKIWSIKATKDDHDSYKDNKNDDDDDNNNDKDSNDVHNNDEDDNNNDHDDNNDHDNKGDINNNHENDVKTSFTSTMDYKDLAKIRAEVLTIPESEWNQEFSVNVLECEYMAMEELLFLEIMKSRHLDIIKDRIRMHDFSKRN